MKEHKEPLRSGGDCRKLKGFGDKICAMIEKKLKDHLGDAYVAPAPPAAEPAKRANKSKNTEQEEHQSTISMFGNVRKRMPTGAISAASPGVASPMQKISRRTAAATAASSTRRYIPAQGSSGFAILVALLRYELESGQQLVNKFDLQVMAQRYCTTNLGGGGGGGSFNSNRFAGWASVKTLLAKKLVERTDDRNSYFYLTSRGRKLARNLAKCCSMLKGRGITTFFSYFTIFAYYQTLQHSIYSTNPTTTLTFTLQTTMMAVMAPSEQPVLLQPPQLPPPSVSLPIDPSSSSRASTR